MTPHKPDQPKADQPDPWEWLLQLIASARPTPPGGQHVGQTKYYMSISTAKELTRTVEAIRAEVERQHAEQLRLLQVEYDHQRAHRAAVDQEIERLTAEHAAEVARLKAEITALRAALSTLVEAVERDDNIVTEGHFSGSDEMQAARAALRAKLEG